MCHPCHILLPSCPLNGLVGADHVWSGQPISGWWLTREFWAGIFPGQGLQVILLLHKPLISMHASKFGRIFFVFCLANVIQRPWDGTWFKFYKILGAVKATLVKEWDAIPMEAARVQVFHVVFSSSVEDILNDHIKSLVHQLLFRQHMKLKMAGSYFR